MVKCQKMNQFKITKDLVPLESKTRITRLLELMLVPMINHLQNLISLKIHPQQRATNQEVHPLPEEQLTTIKKFK